jgi:hypothetical protein
MTSEERFKKIGGNLLVQSELVARFERKVDAWIGQAEGRITQNERNVTQLQAMWQGVMERWDRFLQGREGDGHNAG